jgi:hypothetical protein
MDDDTSAWWSALDNGNFVNRDGNEDDEQEDRNSSGSEGGY